MKSMRLTLPLLFALAATLPEAGCVSIPDDARSRPISTHVVDWRDEIIYQVLVDRFANGDVNNDFRVQPGHLARYQGGDWKGMEEEKLKATKKLANAENKVDEEKIEATEEITEAQRKAGETSGSYQRN